MTRPRLLDLFSGAGGAAVGYARAGFEVVGVDLHPQPRYPFEFHQSNAFRFPLEGFDVVHASPPCQHYSDLARRNGNAKDHPDLIRAVRHHLRGRVFVIENVSGAPLRKPTVLCGVSFPELAVIRHRLFETSRRMPPAPAHQAHPLVYTRDRRKRQFGRLDEADSYVMVNGGGNCSTARAREAMGIDWMTKAELNEAVPPAYTEWIGRHLMNVL